MFGFKGVRGWVLVAAVCGIAAGASAVRAFQPTGPAVGTGAMPLKTLFANVKVLTPEKANCSTSCYYTGSSPAFEVPQGQSYVITDFGSVGYSMESGSWPEKASGDGPNPLSLPGAQNQGAVSMCVVVDDTPIWCTSPTALANTNPKSLTTGMVVGSGSKVTLWARGNASFRLPVFATGYLIRN